MEVSIGVQFLFAEQKDDSEWGARNCSYTGAMVGFWKVEVSIGIRFLFASQKVDSDSEDESVQILRNSLRTEDRGYKYKRLQFGAFYICSITLIIQQRFDHA
ncbi:hypothetical protein [Sphingobacterium sp.]|uniref:hypothetical protein n=1 Tax=Sphingobacterium sp. TaxID=341027 RepID=UPI0028AC20A4|nr:hypothetical protein [Sphingobacterium sp.]